MNRMSSKFQSFRDFRDKPGFRTLNEKLKKVVDNYTFLEITEKTESELNLKIANNIKESKVIIISHYKENDDFYFVLSFKRTILVINQSRIKILQTFLSKKEKIEICFLSESKKVFDDINTTENEAKIYYKEIKNNEFFQEEIKEINSKFFINVKSQSFQYNDILLIIKSCISGYLIKQSYCTYDRIRNFEKTKLIKPRKMTEDEIIKLRVIGTGSIFMPVLCYHIEYEKLVIMKKNLSFNDPEIEKLLKRETQNYEEICHPFIPKFYGTIQYDKFSYPVIEFINGNTLSNSDLAHFSKMEIYKIIIQMLLVINYLNNKKFIYRDLKPNNVMIDKNKTVILIDFDRMVKDGHKYEKNIETAEFTMQYAAPEINYNYITNKCDIYSLGKMIDFLLTKNKTKMTNFEIKELFQLLTNCIKDKPELRPNSTEILNTFIYFTDFKNINESIYYYSFAANQNVPEAQFQLGLIYEKGNDIPRDINKSIYYYSLAANQNYPKAQFNLGVIYYEGKYITRDINKSIYYFSLAAKQNDLKAQFNLGFIYFEGKYIPRNINKSIYYYSLAANQNDPKAQYNLGSIYEKGKYITRDINKSIYYYSLAAKQNYPEAQFALALIYYEGQYISRDINKSIFYYLLAANQNDLKAQYNLGFIYYEGKYVSQDISKSIYYFTLAANQNYPKAQYNLGIIYSSGKYISRDINKSIYYYSLAANQNYPEAQNNLGLIYYEGQYMPQDINKSIYYFSLAAKQNYLQAQFNLGVIYYEGKYITRDINKSIYYYSLAAKQNDPNAQYDLGSIYYEGKYIIRDINKSIYYYSLAANQNHTKAQFALALIYYEGKCIAQDIKKSINFFILGSNQNDPEAQYALGLIYYEGKYITQDINKSIYYFTLAANQNDLEAQYALGLIYFEGKYITHDINKSIYFYSLAANQNDPEAQHFLGYHYYLGYFVEKNINKGLYWFLRSSDNHFIRAHFSLGFLYQEGKSVKRDMKESIHYYNEASSFNNEYAKNNLGIIYKHGFGVEKNLESAKEYFEEAIKQKNDPVSMYNLAHIYIYDECTNENIDKSIDLLKKSLCNEFLYPAALLCIALYIKHEKNFKEIKKEFVDFIEIRNDLLQNVIEYASENGYLEYKDIDFLYNIELSAVIVKEFYREKIKQNTENKLTKEFYKGFGLNIN